MLEASRTHEVLHVQVTLGRGIFQWIKKSVASVALDRRADACHRPAARKTGERAPDGSLDRALRRAFWRAVLSASRKASRATLVGGATKMLSSVSSGTVAPGADRAASRWQFLYLRPDSHQHG